MNAWVSPAALVPKPAITRSLLIVHATLSVNGEPPRSFRAEGVKVVFAKSKLKDPL